MLTTGQRVLLERDEVVAAIESAGVRAVGGSGGLVILEAVAGLGKTSVLAAVTPRLAGAGLVVLRARGSDIERAFPYGVVRQLLERRLLDPGLRERVMVGAACGAEAVVVARDSRVTVAPPAGWASQSPAPLPFQVVHGLYWTVANLCDTSPVALVVDDAHDADPESLRFLTYLAPRAGDLRLLVLVATRPSAQAPFPHLLEDLYAGHGRPDLHLEPLSETAVDCVIAERLGMGAAPEFRAAVLAATGGNPFYLDELLGEAMDRGLTPSTENSPQVRDLGPRAIVRSLLFRLASVPAALPVARACAILGDGARLADVAGLAGLSTEVTAEAADTLIAARILARGSPMRFTHPIVQTAILTDIGFNGRARWHAEAAEMLNQCQADAQVVGLHLLRTAPAANQEWVDVLLRAGRAAAEAGTPDAAVDFLRRALAEPPDDAHVDDVRFELGSVEVSRGAVGGIDLMAAAVAATADVRLRARRSLLLADHQMRAARIPDAVATLDQTLAALSATDPVLTLDLEIERYWYAHLQLGVASGLEDAYSRLRALADHPDDPLRRRLWCYLSLEAARQFSREDAWDLADRALAPPGPLGCLRAESTAVAILALSLATLERFSEFDALTDEVLAAASRTGQHVGHLVVVTFRAQQWLRRGRLLDAEGDALDAIEASTMAGWGHGAPATTAILGAALLDQGRTADARTLLEKFSYAGDPTDYPTALFGTFRGQLRIAMGDARLGLEDLLRVGEAMAELGVLNPGMIDWRIHAVGAYLALGRRSDAEELARANLELATRISGPIATGAALRTLAATVGASERQALLDEAITVLRASSGRLELARSLVALGSLLRHEGHVLMARSPLDEGLELAVGCHALELAQHARTELRASGARPRRAGSNPAALTASEARVARLAMRGLSNSGIAQTLYLSRKTVEKHLANVYRKLQITSRRELTPDTLFAVLPEDDE